MRATRHAERHHDRSRNKKTRGDKHQRREGLKANADAEISGAPEETDEDQR